MPINNSYNEDAIVEAIATALDNFYTNLIKKVDSLNVKAVMKRKNPYLFRAKAMNGAAQIIDAILAAFVSSSEETIFGNVFFEPIATAAAQGQKALAEGVDIMVERDNTIYAIAVKSGTSVFNADSRKKQEQNFMAASKLAQQAKKRFVPIVGYGYGKKKSSNRGLPKFYMELAGKDFWTELTGDEEFYIKLIRFMDKLPEKYVEEFDASYQKAANRLVREFTQEFLYGDNVFEKDGIRRDRTGDGEKTRCLCGKRGIFNRDGPAMGPQIIRQLERGASRRSASFFHALASPGRPRNGGGASGAYQPAEGRKALIQGRFRAQEGPLGPSRKSQQQTKRTGFAALEDSIADEAPEGKRAKRANRALNRAGINSRGQKQGFGGADRRAGRVTSR